MTSMTAKSTMCTVWSTSIGKKFIMALSGLGMLVFVVIHLVGNLQIFLGQDAVNTYSEFLHKIPELLWPIRVGLIACFVAHVWTSIQLSIGNRTARPIGYRQKKSIGASLASRTMLYGGFVILAFVAFHLCHLTWGIVHPEYFTLSDELGRRDVYTATVMGFRDPGIVLLYLIAQIALFLHLNHAIGSAPRSLGLSNQAWARGINWFGKAFSIAAFVGYSSIPLAIWFGLIGN